MKFIESSPIFMIPGIELHVRSHSIITQLHGSLREYVHVMNIQAKWDDYMLKAGYIILSTANKQ